MITARRNPWVPWLLALIGALAAACLPSRIPQAELDERAAGADAASADGQPGDAASADALGCGNAKVESGEQCDFAGASWCSGCDQCQRRATWKIEADASLATPLAPLQMASVFADANGGFSVEFWFKAKQLPGGSDPAGILAIAGKLPAAPAFAIALARDQTKNAAFVTCAYLPKQSDPATGLFLQGSTPVKVGDWHHVRCAWAASEQSMKLSQNGGDPALAKAGAKPTQLFDPGSTLALGSLSLATGKSGFSGELDEFRMLTGPSAAKFSSFQVRYSAEAAGVALLLHMDEAAGSTRLTDDSANKLHLRQTSKAQLGYEYEKTPLLFQPEACYGYSLAQITCQAGQPKAPFCP